MFYSNLSGNFRKMLQRRFSFIIGHGFGIDVCFYINFYYCFPLIELGRVIFSIIIFQIKFWPIEAELFSWDCRNKRM